MNGGEARLSRRPFPIITGWGEVVPPVASVLRAHHVVLMHSESRGRRQGVGPAWVDAVGRPQSPALPPLLLEEQGGRVPTPPLYKERKGATEIRAPSPSASGFLPPSRQGKRERARSRTRLWTGPGRSGRTDRCAVLASASGS